MVDTGVGPIWVWGCGPDVDMMADGSWSLGAEEGEPPKAAKISCGRKGKDVWNLCCLICEEAGCSEFCSDRPPLPGFLSESLPALVRHHIPPATPSGPLP